MEEGMEGGERKEGMILYFFANNERGRARRA